MLTKVENKVTKALNAQCKRQRNGWVDYGYGLALDIVFVHYSRKLVYSGLRETLATPAIYKL